MDEKNRSELLLALILLQHLKGASQREKILQLNIAGFSHVEIADILQTTTAVVSQSLYESRRGRAKRKGRHGGAARRAPEGMREA